jgi:uncharacterized membrane protein YhhN
VTTLAWLLLVAAVPVAAANWWSRWRSVRTLEWVTKPAVTTLILAAALALEPSDGTMRAWFAVGFALCLLGDVLLMLPASPFVAGLAAFLVAHLAFVPGFAAAGFDAPLLGLVAVALAVAMIS